MKYACKMKKTKQNIPLRFTQEVLYSHTYSRIGKRCETKAWREKKISKGKEKRFTCLVIRPLFNRRFAGLYFSAGIKKNMDLREGKSEEFFRCSLRPYGVAAIVVISTL